MTWLIQAGGVRRPQGFVEGYKDVQKKTQYLIFRYDAGPFPQDWRERVPAHVVFGAYDANYPLHIICDAVGYIFFSEPALAVLRAWQCGGFETFPLAASASAESSAKHTLQSPIYYLVNPYREFSAIDIDRSGLEWPDGHRKGAPLRTSENSIVLHGVGQVPDFFAEQEFFFENTIFFLIA